MAQSAASRLLLIAVVMVTLMVMTAVDPEKEKKDKAWKDFIETHGKKYKDDDEEKQRRDIFEKNVEKYELHNAAKDRNYTQGVTQFADMTDEEFKDKVLVHFPAVADHDNIKGETVRGKRQATAPASIDWRTTGCITPVKNQGGCGSCWAFAAVAPLEFLNCRKTGRLVALSEQQIVDCAYADTAYYDYAYDGCEGGWMSEAYTELKKVGGIASSQIYPYYGRQLYCKGATVAKSCSCTGYVKLSDFSGSEAVMQKYVGLTGPMAVALDANQFASYTAGIFYSTSCQPSNPNHAVAVIGYGTDITGKDYWLIKNSWSTTWGEGGFMRIARNAGNNCGVANFATAPLI